MDGPKFEETVPVAGPKFEDTVEIDNKPSLLTSMARGAGQGASLGFGDESGGLGAAASELLPESLGGLPKETDEHRSLWERMKAAYVSGRDDERKLNSAAKEAHPIGYGTGEVIGGTLPFIAAAPESLLGNVAVGAGQGAATAAGMTEANPIEDTGQFAKDVGKGAAFGAGGAALGYGAGKAIGSVLGSGTTPIEEAAAKEAGTNASSESAETLAKSTSESGTTGAKSGTEKTIEEIETHYAPTITQRDATLATMGEKEPRVVAYGKERGGAEALKKAPSLDSNEPGNLRGQFYEGLDRVKTKLDGYEKAAGKAIEDSGVSMSNEELVNTLDKQIADFKDSGFGETDPGKAAIKNLEAKRKSFVNTDSEGNEVVKEGERSAKWLRQYVQGLREENKAFFSKISTGQAYSTEAGALQDFTKTIDNALKERVPGYSEIMEPYSKDLRAYLDVKKSMGRQQVADFFTNKVKKPAQDLLFGVRSPDEKWVKTLADFGEAADQDFLGQSMDRLAYGHLFPDKVSTAEMPSVPLMFQQGLHTAAKIGANPLGGTAQAAGEAAGAVSKVVRRKLFEKAFNEEASNFAKSSAENMSKTASNSSSSFSRTIPQSTFMGRMAQKVAGANEALSGALPQIKAVASGTGEVTGVMAGSPSPTSSKSPELGKLLEQLQGGSPQVSTPTFSSSVPVGAPSESKRNPEKKTESESIVRPDVSYPTPTKMGPYSNLLTQTEQRGGPNAVAAAHYVMIQKDSAYKKQYEAAMGGQ